MKTKMQKCILFIIIFIFVLAFCETISFAGDVINPNTYKTDIKYSDATEIFDKGAVVIGVLRNIAAVVSILSLTIIGIRYMVGSVEQKAEYKQTMLPVVIACLLIGSLSAILALIQSIF